MPYLTLVVGVCRIASFGVAITAGYTGHPALGNFSDERAKTLDKRSPGIGQRAVARQDYPCRSVRRRDWHPQSRARTRFRAVNARSLKAQDAYLLVYFGIGDENGHGTKGLAVFLIRRYSGGS
jgi:hypothetical protein